MEKRIFYNYSLILKNVLQYLPSRVLIILNSFFIVPLFTQTLNPKEISIYLISINLLNLFCTCSFDWISKAVLRFYEKYKLKDDLNTFLSTIFSVSIFIYLFAGLVFILLKPILVTKLAINTLTLSLVILLAIPCGIRQCLYQILRIKNNFSLYTISIILYQILLVITFLSLVNLLPNASSIILSMIFSIILIDGFIISNLSEKYSLKLHCKKEIAVNIFKYSIPLVFTNILYWLMIYLPSFCFQTKEQFIFTSIFGIGLALTSYVIQPLAGLFSFINFPVVVRHYEKHGQIYLYHTNTVQMYLYILLPIVFGLIFYSNNITSIFFPKEYSALSLILPILSVKIFLHELLKLINVKYHLQNKTYIEMAVAILIVGLFVIFNYKLLDNYTLISAALLVLIAEICLILINILLKIKNINYINYKKVSYTGIKLLAIIFLTYTILHFIFISEPNYNLLKIAQIVLFLLTTYFLSYIFRKNILL